MTRLMGIGKKDGCKCEMIFRVSDHRVAILSPKMTRRDFFKNLPSDTSETVDTNVDGLQAVLGSLAVDNISEFGFEGSSSDQESVNVGLGGKSGSGGGVGRTSVKDTGVGGNIGSGNFAKVLTNIGVGVLSLLGGGGETGSNGPDGFVGDDDVLPVLGGENVGVGLDLGENKVVGGSGFTVFKGFSAACEDLDSLVEGVFGLGGDLLVGFTLSATFGVTDKSPFDSHIGYHIGAGFSGEGPISLGPNILDTDGNIFAKSFRDSLDVELRWADNDFGIGRQSGLVEHGNKLLGLGDSSVALPVTSDEEFAGFDLGGGRVGAAIAYFLQVIFGSSSNQQKYKCREIYDQIILQKILFIQ